MCPPFSPGIVCEVLIINPHSSPLDGHAFYGCLTWGRGQAEIVPPPRRHGSEMVKCLQTGNIGAKGKVAVANLQWRVVAYIAPRIECLNDTLSINL